jgi:hypothetical protein
MRLAFVLVERIAVSIHLIEDARSLIAVNAVAVVQEGAWLLGFDLEDSFPNQGVERGF